MKIGENIDLEAQNIPPTRQNKTEYWSPTVRNTVYKDSDHKYNLVIKWSIRDINYH